MFKTLKSALLARVARALAPHLVPAMVTEISLKLHARAETALMRRKRAEGRGGLEFPMNEDEKATLAFIRAAFPMDFEAVRRATAPKGGLGRKATPSLRPSVR